MKTSSKNIVEKDVELTHKIFSKAVSNAMLALGELGIAQVKAVKMDDFDPIADYLDKTISSTHCFGLAQLLIKDLAELTDMLNKAMPKKHLLGNKVSEESIAKGEVIRTVYLANWLKTVVDELNEVKNA